MNQNQTETMQFRCGACASTLEVPRSLAGETGPCPVCQVVITAPLPVRMVSSDSALTGSSAVEREDELVSPLNPFELEQDEFEAAGFSPEGEDFGPAGQTAQENDEEERALSGLRRDRVDGGGPALKSLSPPQGMGAALGFGLETQSDLEEAFEGGAEVRADHGEGGMGKAKTTNGHAYRGSIGPGGKSPSPHAGGRPRAQREAMRPQRVERASGPSLFMPVISVLTLLIVGMIGFQVWRIQQLGGLSGASFDASSPGKPVEGTIGSEGFSVADQAPGGAGREVTTVDPGSLIPAHGEFSRFWAENLVSGFPLEEAAESAAESPGALVVSPGLVEPQRGAGSDAVQVVEEVPAVAASSVPLSPMDLEDQAEGLTAVSADPPSPAPAPSPAPERASEDAAATEPGEGPKPAGSLDWARHAVRQFLLADHWEKRMPYIHDADSRREMIRAHYENRADLPMMDYRLDFFHSEIQKARGTGIYVFFLTFANEQDGFPMIVKEAAGEYRVDWDLFVEFKDRHFKEFIESQPSGVHHFRVVIQRVTYWEDDREAIPGIENLVCYKIDPPYPGYTRYAFVPKETEKGDALVSELSWEADPLAAEVAMHWATFENGRPYLEIDELVSRTWVRH